MCGRLRVGKRKLHVACWSVHHVFGLLVRLIRTLAINALRGSGPSQKHAFEHAMALVGCPMFRDREWRGLSY